MCQARLVWIEQAANEPSNGVEFTWPFTPCRPDCLVTSPLDNTENRGRASKKKKYPFALGIVSKIPKR